MSNWVEPEWLPTVPVNDRGPFHCYVLWAGDTRQYYAGHTNDPEARIEEHFDGMVMTTAGHSLRLLWVSGPLRLRTDARRFEAALKSYIKSRNGAEFERCTGLYFARGSPCWSWVHGVAGLAGKPRTCRRSPSVHGQLRLVPFFVVGRPGPGDFAGTGDAAALRPRIGTSAGVG